MSLAPAFFAIFLNSTERLVFPTPLWAKMIVFFFSLGLLFLAIFLSVKSKGTGKILKNGKGGFFGEVISKSDRRIFAFYYKL